MGVLYFDFPAETTNISSRYFTPIFHISSPARESLQTQLENTCEAPGRATHRSGFQ
jgi:hypothetical protein